MYLFHRFISVKRFKILFCLAAVLAGVVSSEAASQITWNSPADRQMLTSDSQPWGSGFHFEMGSFKNGFAPTTTNTAQWASNWVAAQRSGYNITNHNFGEVYNFTNNPIPFTNGAKIYIWGFSGSEALGEWFLATKTNWSWIDGGNNLTKNLSTGSASAVLGTINTNTNAPFHIQTTAITNAMPPATSWGQWAPEELGQIPPPGPSGDLNTNAVTDAWEYALNSPTPNKTPDTANWLQVADENGDKYLEIHIPRRRDHAATFTVEVTSDLVAGPWLSGTNVTEIVSDTPSALVIRDKTPIGQGNDKRFMRVKVTVGS